jgi:hypothetical protein
MKVIFELHRAFIKKNALDKRFSPDVWTLRGQSADFDSLLEDIIGRLPDKEYQRPDRPGPNLQDDDRTFREHGRGAARFATKSNTWSNELAVDKQWCTAQAAFSLLAGKSSR